MPMPMPMPMPTPLTLIEKIATRYAVGLKPGQAARQGAIITIRPKHIMTHDNTSAVMGKFKEIFKDNASLKPRIHDPRQPVFAIDHDIQNTSPENLGKYAKIAQFARQHHIDFYPAGTGISHQVMVEYGYATPGSMVVGSDSHSNLYGGVNCLGTPVVRTDAACIWATGVTWWKVPPVARVTLTGRLRPGVVGKDVIIALCGVFNNDEVLNMAVEFGGDGIAGLTMDQRLSIANMTTEWGALAGVFPFDEMLRNYLHARADLFAKRGDDPPKYTRADVDAWYADRLDPDTGAHYAVELSLDLSSVIPHVSGPDHVKVMHALPEIQKQQVKINKAYLLSCVNARLEDLREAASVLKGRRVADGVQMYVAAASAEVQSKASEDGTWQTLIDSGASMLPPGCGTCIGLGVGTLEAGEVGISATNRNFKGRMGSRDAKAYLGSPAVVAASAAAGYICSPTSFENVKPVYSVKFADASPATADGEVDIIEGFPERLAGRALWLPVDNLNTDGIYSGKLTYRDDVTPQEMAAAAMANYDPQFQQIAQRGDIIVAGRNFGTGSSREQAATCLELRGIQLVVAASFSETYARNAYNNGFILIDCPAFSDDLRASLADRRGATIAGPHVEIDFRRSRITCDGKSFPFPPLSPTAQELIVAGGAENVAKKRLAAR
ncbi:MAG: homoaconitase [Phycisphaerales bacterium]|nr:homoaconitase [Phycisphaerales bacterium]